MYPIVKQIHVILVVVSICLFQFRYWRYQVQNHPTNLLVRIAPHGIDTLLLVTGLALLMMAGFSPMNSSWLMAKLIALVVYIGFGMLAMKKFAWLQWVSYLIATTAVIYMIYCARYKVIWP